MKKILLNLWSIDAHVRAFIRTGNWLSRKLPFFGTIISMIIDRVLFHFYGIDCCSRTIFVRNLSIPHPIGVLLGGNGIRSNGRVLVNAGVKLVGRSPDDEKYLEKHAQQSVFEFGDNVVIGSNSVVVGPVKICSNVIIATMTLVNADITEPGLYVGIPARKLSDQVSDVWVRDLERTDSKSKATSETGK